MEDALQERERLGYKFNEASFNSKWAKDNPAEKFSDKFYKEIALRGATPTTSNGQINRDKIELDHVYMIEPGMLPGVTKTQKMRLVRDSEGRRGFEEVR